MSSIQKRPNGKWRARYQNDEGRELAAHFDLKREAEAWLADRVSEVRSGAWIDPRKSRTTLGQFYAEWSTRQLWADSTRRAIDHAMSQCTFSNVELRALRRSHVESWVKGMDLAPSTVAVRFKYVRSVLRAAVRDQLMVADPAEGVTLPRRRRSEHSMVIPTTEQVRAIIHESDEWMRPWVALMAFAGLRIGEASAVQVDDVQFLKRRLHVQRQLQNHKGTRLVLPPKQGSERHVGLPDDLLTMLSRHVDLVGTRGPEGWLFNGAPPSPNGLRRWFQKACARAGVEGVTPHDLRHFYASALIASGCDVVTVQKALGHAKASFTLDIYSHLWPTAEDRTRAATADLMGAVLSPPADRSRTKAT